MLKLAQKTVAKRRCHRCHGSGHAYCQICHGKGLVMKGRDKFSAPIMGSCDGCMGRKTTRCKLCGGEGLI